MVKLKGGAARLRVWRRTPGVGSVIELCPELGGTAYLRGCRLALSKEDRTQCIGLRFFVLP